MAPLNTESIEGLESKPFDFVIVGGGTAGLVVANRLTEDPSVSVIVLEAGTNRLDDPRVMVPGLGVAAFEDADFDWNFRSIAQVSCPVNQLEKVLSIVANPWRWSVGTTQRSQTPSKQRSHARRFLSY